MKTVLPASSKVILQTLNVGVSGVVLFGVCREMGSDWHQMYSMEVR